MNIFAQIRSLFSGQTQEAFGAGQRHPLSKAVEKAIRLNVVGLRRADLTGYEFERRPSDQRDAKSDLIVYDTHKKAVLFGRDMYGSTSFWEK